MRRLVLAAALALALGAGVESAAAHPLGNFSVNHLVQVRVSHDRVDVRYLLDQAEIPTFQERGMTRAEVLAGQRAEVARRLVVTVDGRRLALRPAGRPRLTFPAGEGGLRTTRLELPLRAAVRDPRDVRVRDGTFPGRAGWKAIVPLPGAGTAVRSSAPSGDPTRGLRAYPEALLRSPSDEREARLAVRPGSGTLVAPEAPGGDLQTTTQDRGGGGFAGLFEDAAAGRGVLLFLLLAAFAWGAFHALSPGHGKAMVAAYLVGTRGTARHALALGATVTVTHTAGVFALGLVTLALSQYLVPEDLYPWLELTSGLLVLLVGAGVLRARVRGARAARAAAAHSHDHVHHHHHAPDRITWRGLVGMGAAAGLIPCPSALVVLLGAIGQHQVGLGLLLIVAFSLGLAATLSGLGLAVVHAGRLAVRVGLSRRVAATLPALSALVIVAAGFLLTARAVPGVV